MAEATARLHSSVSSAPPTWARRALSIPTYLALAALCLPAAPLMLALAFITDLVSGEPARAPRVRAMGFFLVYLACEAIGILAATLLWLRFGGGRLGSAEPYVAANAALQRWWTSTILRTSLRLFSVRMHVEGEACLSPAPFLLFVRHSSTADTVLAAELVGKRHRLLLRYVLKMELLWDPCLDLVGLRLPNAFISRRAERSGEALRAITALTHGLDARSAVLLYPEGTRFSPEKREQRVSSLRAQGQLELAELASRFRSVLPPKLGGALALMEAAPGLDVVFLEHVGFEGAATFTRFWTGALIGRDLHVRFRRFAARDIPAEARARWLFERWAELDRWVTERAEGGPPLA